MQFSKSLGYANNVVTLQEERSIIQSVLSYRQDATPKTDVFVCCSRDFSIISPRGVKVDSKVVIAIVEKPICTFHNNFRLKGR